MARPPEDAPLEAWQLWALDQQLAAGEITRERHREIAFLICPDREPALRDALSSIRASSDKIWEQIAGASGGSK